MLKRVLRGYLRKKLKLDKVPWCSAVVVAAGNASRMGGIDKIMTQLDSEPVIIHSVRAFQKCRMIREIVVVTREELVPVIEKLCREQSFDKVTAVVCGGADRVASTVNGLNAVSEKCRLAAIHDGARPLISQVVIENAVRKAAMTGAAAPAVPVKDTIKEASGSLVTGTPDRSRLFAVQTPQVFDYDLLRGALEKVQKEALTVTDDCSAVELLGMSIHLTQGAEENMKITTPVDLAVAELLMKGRKET